MTQILCVAMTCPWKNKMHFKSHYYSYSILLGHLFSQNSTLLVSLKLRVWTHPQDYGMVCTYFLNRMTNSFRVSIFCVEWYESMIFWYFEVWYFTNPPHWVGNIGALRIISWDRGGMHHKLGGQIESDIILKMEEDTPTAGWYYD